MKRYALITGASKGLGVEFAKQLAERGYSLVLTARSEELLRRVIAGLPEPANHLAIPLDLTKPDAAQQLFQQCQNRGIDVEVLVNNAGFGQLGNFLEQDPKRLAEMVQLNALTPAILTRLFAPSMRVRGWGHVLNVASIAGFGPMPYFAVYAATKAMLLSLSQGLDAELRPQGIHVTALCPGPTKTEFFSIPGMKQQNFGLDVMDAKPVVKQGLDGLFAGKACVVPGWKNRLMTILSTLTPTQLSLAVVSKLAKP